MVLVKQIQERIAFRIPIPFVMPAFSDRNTPHVRFSCVYDTTSWIAAPHLMTPRVLGHPIFMENMKELDFTMWRVF